MSVQGYLGDQMLSVASAIRELILAIDLNSLVRLREGNYVDDATLLESKPYEKFKKRNGIK